MELNDTGVKINQITVSRWLKRVGVNRPRQLDVNGVSRLADTETSPDEKAVTLLES